MPCHGPDFWENFHSPEETSKRENRKIREYIQYTQNTAYLLKEVLKHLDISINKTVEKGCNIDQVNKKICDYVTSELCSILKEAKNNNEISSKLANFKYIPQLLYWKYEHDKLDKRRDETIQ